MSEQSINKFCPRSGKPIQADSLTHYRGYQVGFCNPGCRNEFASNPAAYPSDRHYFDTLLIEYELPEH
ncbi:MAG: YHS domain-containing protein [Leptolyngbya sp. SIO1D8]|nr:YHS domain-containing protein [Leptolyngbya sp. SIO1D8]